MRDWTALQQGKGAQLWPSATVVKGLKGGSYSAHNLIALCRISGTAIPIVINAKALVIRSGEPASPNRVPSRMPAALPRSTSAASRPLKYPNCKCPASPPIETSAMMRPAR